MTNHTLDACTSYLACTIAYTKDIDWATVGAVILLIARLVKDVPEAYDAIRARIKKNKNDKSK